WQVVRVNWRPLGVTCSPAKFCSARHVIDASRAIPRHSEIPFHIRVVGEDVSYFVVVKIKCVSETGADQLPVSSLRIDSCDPSTWCHSVVGVTSWIFDQWEKIIFLPHI